MLLKRTKAVLLIGLFLLFAGEVNASLVVSAKDSPGKSKADFRCDGKNDQVEIQKAIDALPSTGGVVELLEGTFNFSDDVEITKDNVTIRGAGKSTILKHNPTYWVKLTKDSEKGNKTIAVENVKQFHVGQLIGITNEDIHPTAENSPEKYKEKVAERATYYYIVNYTYCDLYLIKKIKGKTITLDRGLKNPMLMSTHPRTAPAWVMVKAYGRENLELSDFSIDCNRDNVAKVMATGEYSHHPGPEPVRPKDYVCPFPELVKKVHHGEEITSAVYMESAHNSRFRNLYLHDISMSGIFLIESHYILVEGNTIRDFGLKGYVDCFGDYTQIIGNVIENSLCEDGINVYARDSSYAVVSNNIVRNCPRGAIFLNQGTKVAVTGNVVSGAGNGIAVVSQEAAVTGNYIENAAVAGILVYTLTDFWRVQPDDCPITVMGNSLRDCAIGLHVITASNANLIGNSVARSKVAAVRADAQSNRLIISNNQFLNANTDDVPCMQLGGDNHFIFGNKIKGFRKGVLLQSTAEGNVIEKNEFIEVSESIVDEGKENIQKDNCMPCTRTE